MFAGLAACSILCSEGWVTLDLLMTSIHHLVKLIPPRLSLTIGIIWPLVLQNDQSEPECIDCGLVCLIVCNLFIKKEML